MNSYTIQNIVAASISNFYDLQNFIVHIIFEYQSLIQYIYINNLRKQKLPCIKQCNNLKHMDIDRIDWIKTEWT